MLYNVNNTYNEDMYTISLLEDVDVLLSYIDNNTITDRIEYNLAYNYCNSLIEQYITTGNDEYIESILNEDANSQENIIKNADGSITRTVTREIDEEDVPSWAKEELEKDDVSAQEKEEHEKEWGLNVKSHALRAYDSMKQGASNAVQWAKDNPKKMAAGIGTAALAAGGYLAYKKRDKIKDKLNKARISAYHLVGKQTPEEIKAQQEREEQEKARLAQQQMERIKQEAANKPKSWIGKKIAALRSLYSNYLNKARQAHNAGQAGIFQNIARIILNCIDWLLNKLQHIAG